MSTVRPITSNSVIPIPEGPRKRIYRIPKEMLGQMLRGELALNIPADVELTGFWPDRSVDRDYFHETDVVLCVTLEHSSFEPVAWKIPVVDVIERKKPARVEVALVKKARA